MSQSSESMHRESLLPPVFPEGNALGVAHGQGDHFRGLVSGKSFDGIVNADMSSPYVTEMPVHVPQPLPRRTVPPRPQITQNTETNGAADLFASFVTSSRAASPVTQVEATPIQVAEQLPPLPQMHKSAVFVVPSRPKRAEAPTDSTIDTKSMRKTTVAPFADQEVRQSVTEQPEVQGSRAQERAAVRRRQAAKRHTNPISHRAYHETGKPRVFHPSQGAGITARDASNRQRRQLVREQQAIINQADQEYGIPRRWGNIGNAALTGSHATPRVSETPIVQENTTMPEVVPQARVIQDESMPLVIQHWLREAVWTEDEQAPNTPKEIQVVTPLPPLMPAVRRQPTTELISEADVAAQISALVDDNDPDAILSSTPEEQGDNKDEATSTPPWLRDLQPSGSLVQPIVPVGGGRGQLRPLTPSLPVSSAPTPKTAAELQAAYTLAFDEAVGVIAEQRSGFVGAEHGRVLQHVYEATRRFGRFGEALRRLPVFRNEAAIDRREAVLEQYRQARSEYIEAEQMSHDEEIDFRLDELERFEDKVEDARTAQAQLGGTMQAPQGRGRRIVGAIMSSPLLRPVVGGAIGAGAAVKANLEQVNPAAHVALDLGAIAVAGLIGYLDVGMRENAAVQGRVRHEVRTSFAQAPGRRQARALREQVANEIGWDDHIQEVRDTVGQVNPEDQLVPNINNMINKLTEAQIRTNAAHMRQSVRNAQHDIRRMQVRNAIIMAGSAALAASAVELVSGAVGAINSALHQGAQHASATPTAPNHPHATPTQQPTTHPNQPTTGSQTGSGGQPNIPPHPKINVDDVPYNVAAQVAEKYHMAPMQLDAAVVDKLNAAHQSGFWSIYTNPVTHISYVMHNGHIIRSEEQDFFGRAILRYFPAA